jgi:hypothetical protein
MSGYAPAWRRLLHRLVPCLFKRCPAGNYHWRTDNACLCMVGVNAHGVYLFHGGYEYVPGRSSLILQPWREAR